MKKARVRFIWADIVKGAAILAVITFHSGFLPLQHQLLPLITPWMLPIFAVLYGALSNDSVATSVRSKIIQRAKKFAIPYLYFGGSSYLLWLSLRGYAPQSALFSDWRTEFIHFITGEGMIFNGPLWFLPSYLIAVVLYELSKQYLTKIQRYYLPILSLLFVVAGKSINPHVLQYPYSVDIAVQFYGFMLFGRILKDVQTDSSQVKLSIMYAVYCLLCWYNGTVDIFERKTGNIFIFWVAATSGSYLAISASKYVERFNSVVERSLSTLGESSMLLLVTHWPLMQWLTYVLDKVGLLTRLNGTPTHVSFSYYNPNKYIFTLFELPLLIAYTAIPMIVIPIRRRLRRRRR